MCLLAFVVVVLLVLCELLVCVCLRFLLTPTVACVALCVRLVTGTVPLLGFALCFMLAAGTVAFSCLLRYVVCFMLVAGTVACLCLLYALCFMLVTGSVASCFAAVYLMLCACGRYRCLFVCFMLYAVPGGFPNAPKAAKRAPRGNNY